MGLTDTVKSLQAQEEKKISRELAWLRKLRTYTEEWTDEKLIAECDGLEAYYHTEKGQGDGLAVSLQLIDILEKGSLAAFYRAVLEYAAKKQKQDKIGGGEKAIRLHWEQLQRMEKYIKRRYEKQRRETDGNNKG